MRLRDSEHQRELIRQLHREHEGDEIAICDVDALVRDTGKVLLDVIPDRNIAR